MDKKAALTPMRFKRQSKTFLLDPLSIDTASFWLTDALAEMGIEKLEVTRVRLLFEEALLNFADHFGKDQEVSIFLEKQVGRYRVRVLARGDQYNPLRRSEQEDDDYIPSLFSTIGGHVQYSYGLGVNSLRLPFAPPSQNPLINIFVAILAGVIAGWLGNILIPTDIQIAITDTILNPISDMWIRLLQCVSGPIIFFTALAASMSTKRISDYGGSRFAIVAHYFIISALVVSITTLAITLLSSSEIGSVTADRDMASSLLDNILKIVPGNIIDPLSEANTPQLLLIAIAMGYILASMGPQVEGLKSLVQQANLFGLTLSSQICAVVPYFVGLLLCLKIWTQKTSVLERLWIPLIVSVGAAAVMLLVTLLITSAYLHTNPIVLAQKLKGPFLGTLRSGTLSYATVDVLADSCKESLGVDKEFSSASLLQGLVLYTPASAIGICVFVLFFSHTQHLEVTFIWVLAAVALSVTLAVATPPVTGANLLAFVVAFGYLGISNDVFLDAMIFDLVFSVFCIATDQAMLQLDVTMHAKRLGFLNERKLREPIASKE